MENHQAYIQSWISDLKEKPETLTAAIKTAEYTSDYMEYHAGIISREEYQNRTMDISMQTAAHLVGELQNNGYPVSPAVRSMVKSLTEAVPGIHNLRDLHEAYKNKNLLEKFSPDEKKTISELGNTLRNLELSKNYIPEQE